MTLTIIQYRSQFSYTVVSIIHYLYLSKLDYFSRCSKLLMVYIWMIYIRLTYIYVYVQNSTFIASVIYQTSVLNLDANFTWNYLDTAHSVQNILLFSSKNPTTCIYKAYIHMIFTPTCFGDEPISSLADTWNVYILKQ
jgi:hypothetical protein